MDIFGGFMMIIWLAGFFLAVIWFILPFVIFSIKARSDETLARIGDIEARLTAIENKLPESGNLPPMGET